MINTLSRNKNFKKLIIHLKIVVNFNSMITHYNEDGILFMSTYDFLLNTDNINF